MSSSSSRSSSTEEDRNITQLERLHYFTHDNCKFDFTTNIEDGGVLGSEITDLGLTGWTRICRVNNKDCRELNR